MRAASRGAAGAIRAAAVAQLLPLCVDLASSLLDACVAAAAARLLVGQIAFVPRAAPPTAITASMADGGADAAAAGGAVVNPLLAPFASTEVAPVGSDTGAAALAMRRPPRLVAANVSVDDFNKLRAASPLAMRIVEL